VKRAAALVFFAAVVAQAAVTDPFPDQPGALAAAELAAASVAMKQLPGNPSLPLAASGKRAPGHPLAAYALFATPYQPAQGNLRVRRQVVCNQLSGAWTCAGPHEHIRAVAGGMEHGFAIEAIGGAGDRDTALAIVRFMYTPCFFERLEAAGGKRFVPSPDADYVSSLVDDGKGFNVATGPLADGKSYRLERLGQSEKCAFRILQARNARTGEVLPESNARDTAKFVPPAAAQLEPKRAMIQIQGGQPYTMAQLFFDMLADGSIALNLLSSLLAVVLPPLVLLRNRRSAGFTAAVLFGLSLSSGIAVLVFLKLAAITDTGNSLLLVIPATILGMIGGGAWAAYGLAAPEKPRC
jgi:hypothetical protein